jgi:hypothetical protein
VTLPGAPPPLSFLVVDTDPLPGVIAVPGLLLVALATLTYTALAARKAEIAYSE